MTIRFATELDYKDCCEIEAEAFQDPWKEETFTSFSTQSEFFHIVVSEDDNEITGYAIYSNIFGSLELMRIAVKSKFRRQGIADKILKFIIEKESSKELFECFLEVRPSNNGALNLYKKNGFTEIGLRKAYYSNGEDAIILSRKQ